MAALDGLVAHGGIYGAFVELAGVLAIAGLFVWVYVRERRREKTEGPAELTEE